MRLQGWLWIRFLLLLARLRLYRIVRDFLVHNRIDADLLVEVGDHDGTPVRYRDLPWMDSQTHTLRRPRSTDD